MSRYRPPRPLSSKYITPEGYERLRAELDHLWRVRRPEVTRAVSEAAAMGDRSENAEYIYGKKQLREIDSRVRFLRKRLEEMMVVREPPADPSRIFFGAWVRLEDDDGNEALFRIVGPDEIGDRQGYISIDSPLARALLKKQVDDEVTLELQCGEQSYAVLEIAYRPPQSATGSP